VFGEEDPESLVFTRAKAFVVFESFSDGWCEVFLLTSHHLPKNLFGEHFS